MRYDAEKEKWMPMEIRGVQGHFCDIRIDRASVPGWFHFWELADGDSDGIPCRYKPQILANFYGTFLTTGELPVDCREWTERFIGSDEDWGFTGGGQFISFQETVRKELERMAAEKSFMAPETVMWNRRNNAGSENYGSGLQSTH